MSSMGREILFLEPVFKDTIWGGNRLAEEYGYAQAGDHTGECWAVSAHAHGDCVIRSGEYAGKTLSQLWKEEPQLFGTNLQGDFPLLVKIIDAKSDLSIQVHPDDAYASVHENGSFGKTECWYILDCEEDTTIVIGHHAQTKEELAQMIEDKEWKQLIREIPVKKGDFFQINPGCVHAIKGGTLILETQQSSDITYRVYDYDRLTDGKPRQLHIAQSLDVIEVPFKDAVREEKICKAEGYTETELVSCAYYTVKKVDVTSSYTLGDMDGFVNVSVLEGSGEIGGQPVCKGTHCIIPAHSGDVEFAGELSVIFSYV